MFGGSARRLGTVFEADQIFDVLLVYTPVESRGMYR